MECKSPQGANAMIKSALSSYKSTESGTCKRSGDFVW